MPIPNHLILSIFHNLLSKMDNPLPFTLFSMLSLMVIVWFGMCRWTFRRLETRHPGKYLQLERPSLFLRNNLKSNWLFMRFIWRSEYLLLNDPPLTRMCASMKTFCYAYFFLFISTVFVFFSFM